MAKSLTSLPLPDGMTALSALAIEHDEETGRIYEMWMLDTRQPFDAATASLAGFVTLHFGGSGAQAATTSTNLRSWAASWSLDDQEVSAQLTGTDGHSAGYLRNTYSASDR